MVYQTCYKIPYKLIIAIFGPPAYCWGAGILLRWPKYCCDGRNIVAMAGILLRWPEYCCNGRNIVAMAGVLLRLPEYCCDGRNIVAMAEILLQWPEYCAMAGIFFCILKSPSFISVH